MKAPKKKNGSQKTRAKKLTDLPSKKRAPEAEKEVKGGRAIGFIGVPGESTDDRHKDWVTF